MKGDFSRRTFDRAKHYAGVEMQQGRVQLDADWNEQGDIVRHRIRTESRDVIGPSGGPMFDAAFEIVGQAALSAAELKSLKARGIDPLVANDIYLRPGRYYVDGVLCENDAVVPLTRQPDLLDVAAPDPTKHYIVYLDVWDRHITALDDSHIREVALGGPDTATRRRVIWQVKLAATNPVGDNCLVPVVGTPSTGLVTASLATPLPNADECIVPESAGYRSLENQLYRVEIHTPGPVGTATFKWSRDNGSIVTTIQSVDAINKKKITVADLGRDELLGFRADDWVEITDEGTELAGLPGALHQIDGAPDAVARTITLKALPTINFARSPKLRRWDQTTASDIKTKTTVIELEFGVQVAFSGGNDDSGNPRRYNTGDYWLIPARTATGDPLSGKLDWPTLADKITPAALPAAGIRHHYARIATLDWATATSTWTITDCRHLFPPITELTSLFYLGGDGQEGEIDPLNPSVLIPLPEVLQVGVANGSWPVAGAPVKFKVVAPSAGRLVNPVTNADVTEVVVLTADGSTATPKGVAAIVFKMDAQIDANRRPLHPHQQVIATLLNAKGDPVHLPVTFTASLERDAPTLSYAGGDGQEAHRGRPLPAPLRVLVSDDWSVATGAQVRFSVQSASAKPFAEEGTLSTGAAAAPGAATLIVATDPTGIAQCYWTPSANATEEPSAEWVVATLVNAANQPIVGQGTLEFFCHDLSFHNRHLHGYGIVCGLEVYCGPNGGGTSPIREFVTVRNGYAIDSFGKDILVKADAADGDRLAMLKMVRDSKLLDDPTKPGALKDGAVSLTLTAARTPTDRYGLELYDPQRSSWARAFDDTFWTDVWTDCVKPWLNHFDAEFSGDGAREHIITFLNVSAQSLNAQHGPRVFISTKEDKILRDFYAKLRDFLTSKTFCALSDPARYRPLPDYDPSDPGLARPITVFSAMARQRVRLEPSGRYAFLVGDDDTIQVLDVRDETPAVAVKFPTPGATVKDVAFSAKGDQVLAIAVGSANQALLAVGTVKASAPIAIEWQTSPALQIFDSPLSTLQHSDVPDAFYAIAPGRGLFRIDPKGGAPAPVAEFNALGHLEIGDVEGVSSAYATVDNGNGQYQTVLRLDLRKNAVVGTFQLPGIGSDDICVAADSKSPSLFVVVSPQRAQRSKQLFVFNAALSGSTDRVDQTIDLGWEPPPNDTSSVDTSGYRLAYSEKTRFLLIASAEAYVVKRYNVAKQGPAIEADIIPAQIAPIAIASDATKGFAAVYNGISTTLTVIPPTFVSGSRTVQMDKLAEYHTAMLNAFIDLTGAFAQALKDCICDHLLVKCAAAESKTLYLARIDIRDQQIYNICNFSRRKYVHTFPAVEYWLSIVPIIPVITKLIGDACCRPIVDLFTKMNAPDAAKRGDLVPVAAGMKAMTFARTFDWKTMVAPRLSDRASVLGAIGKAFVAQHSGPAAATPAPSVTVPAGQFVGKSAAAATDLLSNERIQVAGTERLALGVQTRDMLLAPSTIHPNDAVTLVVDNQNNVVGYRMASAPPTTSASAPTVPASLLTAELAKRDAQITELTNTLNGLKTSQAQELQTRDTQIAALGKRVDVIAKVSPTKPQ